MQAVKFPEANTIFKAPKGQENEVDDLHVRRATLNPEGFVALTSCWELSDQDIENILKTRKIYLNICGAGHPPVFLSTYLPS